MSERITGPQFEALTELRNTRSPAAQEAARLVLVEGFELTDAAARAGVSVQSAGNAKALMLERLDICRRAAGIG